MCENSLSSRPVTKLEVPKETPKSPGVGYLPGSGVVT